MSSKHPGDNEQNLSIIFPFLLGSIMKRLVSLLLLLTLTITGYASIDKAIKLTTPDFNHYLSVLANEAKKAGIKPTTIKNHLLVAKLEPKVIQHDQFQPELVLTYQRYMSLFVTKTRVNNGILFYRRNHSTLLAISKEYQVQPQYLVALLGAESNYGATMGNFPVISALSTLAYADRRHLFFKRELIAALKIIQEHPDDQFKLLGSWAGAMGQCQFMPDLYLAYAVAYKSKGPANIWANSADALASTANFVHHLGWNYQQGVAFQVNLPVNFSLSQLGRSNPKTIAEWKKLNITSFNGKPFPNWQGKLAIIVTSGSPMRAYLVSSNFFVLLRWNDAYLYALAINQIAQQIKKGALITTPLKTVKAIHKHKRVIKTAPHSEAKPQVDYQVVQSELLKQWHDFLNQAFFRFYTKPYSSLR